MKRLLYLLPIATIALLPAVSSAQGDVRAFDSSLTQKWTGEFGYSFLLPANAKYNTIGSGANKGSMAERANFIIPGGNGSITIDYVTEEHMVPKDYKLLDSMHYFEVDSTGRNGMIHRRMYILSHSTVQMDILLTAKGEKEYGSKVKAIFDSFVPPPGAGFAMEAWRYGRDPREYEKGRYGSGTGPDRK